jgi:FimV-like protein
MVALLKANPSAFSVSCNMNSLKSGTILRQPSLTEIQALSPEEARKVHRQQDQAWKAYRSRKKEIVCSPIENATTEAPVEAKSVPTTGSQEPTTAPVESQVTTDKIAETVAPATTLAQSQEPVTTPAEKIQESAPVAKEEVKKTVVSKETVAPPVEATEKATPTTTLAQSQEPVTAPVEKVQESSLIVKEVTPPGPSTETTPLKTTEELVQSTSSKPVDLKPIVLPNKMVEENSQQDSMGATDRFFTTQLFSGKIIVAIIVCVLLSAFLIGWILHRIAQRRKPPTAETLESHPLFDSIDKVLLTGQLPKN